MSDEIATASDELSVADEVPDPPQGEAPVASSRVFGRLLSVGLGLATGIAASILLLAFSSEIRDITVQAWPGDTVTRVDTVTGAGVQAKLDGLDRRVSKLQSRLRSKLPQRPYLVVSTSDNRFELRGTGDVLREGICSTGSYVLLKGGQDQEWMFETPRGSFRILQKKVNPVWAKPDWAFVEEGLPIPPPGAPERFERGALGYYALAIGNGYLIHGTLYQRFLGQPVTHGCIRLGDEDLEAVYRALALGARVYIY